MKKVLAIFLCFSICLSLGGCNNAEKKNEEAKEALTKVLNKEENFIVHNVYLDQTTEENLGKFHYPTDSDALNVFLPVCYTFADFDADGVDELLMVDVLLIDYLFLRYDDGKVYGYVHRRIEGQDVKTDGSFITYSRDGFKAISRISFSGNSYEITNQAYLDDSKKIYLIDDKSVQKSEVEKYFEDWNKNTTKVSWENIN